MNNDFASIRPGLGLAALLAGAIAIAFAPIFVKISEVGPAATAFHRMLLSLPFFVGAFVVWPASGKRAAPTGKTTRTYLLLALAGAFFAGDLAVWHWSIRLTTVANATLFANAAPIFVALAAWGLLGETFSRRFIIGLVVAIVGTILVVGASFGGHGSVLGDALGLLTAGFYAGYLICVKMLRRSVGTLDIMMWSGLVATPLLLVVALASGESLIATTLSGWFILLGLAIISHTFGQSLIAFALAHLAASFSSLTLLVQPVAATLPAWLLLNEGLRTQQAIGGIAVLAGILLARERVERPKAIP